MTWFRRPVVWISLLLVVAMGALAAPASAARAPRDVERLTFRKLVDLRPGTNIINFRSFPKPRGPGYVVRMAGNLTYLDGRIPRSDRIHLHHAVWLQETGGSTNPKAPIEILSETGEEKTIFTVPRPYGVRVEPEDRWVLNDMIHDLTPHGARLYVTYTVDYVKADSTLGRRLHPVTPLWMDVQSGKVYPVFDVPLGAGRNGRYTYPDQASDPYGKGPARNLVTIDRPGTLVGFGGHLHPGALHADLRLRRAARSKLLFRSEARYFGGRPPVSWDMATTVTPSDWRVRVVPGDVLSISATYDSSRASWYESMGIMLGWIAYDDTSGRDPFAGTIATRGHITHRHLAENDHWGGAPTGLPNASALRPGAPASVVRIAGFRYEYGDLSRTGASGNPPTVPAGRSLEFVNEDASRDIFHTVTACKAPCNLSTGLGYPLPNGSPVFDSGQLGFGQVGFTAAANRNTWDTPTNLSPGTYTYLCRGHPFMRGAFRVVAVK